MFGFLKRNSSNNSSVPPGVNDSSLKWADNNPNYQTQTANSSEESEINTMSIDVQVEVGGGKGWPSDVSCVAYHPVQGLICAGTQGGAIYVHGDGFQYVRPWLTDDANEVVTIVPIFPDRILVLFSNNSIVVMELPTLDVVDLLEPSWLAHQDGDVTSIHNDLPSEKSFIYIGTSKGSLLVLDIMASTIRICDYKLSYQELHLMGNSTKSHVKPSHVFTLRCIQSCPKDDRFIALGYSLNNAKSNEKDNSGDVVIFDFVKHKVHRQHHTPSITTLAWHHSGEILYAGTLKGAILQIGLEKPNCTEIWNSVQEKSDNDDEILDEDIYDDEVNDENADLDIDDEDEIVDSKNVPISKLVWLPPQPPSQEGCLFALLANKGDDNDGLRNVIIGLSPLGIHGEMNVVLSLPPIPTEKITSMTIVPTYEKAMKNLTREGAAYSQQISVSFTNSYSHNVPTASNLIVTPALLITVQDQESDGNDFYRYLQILRCPRSPIGEWSLEIGALPDPRKAMEVLPSNSEITCLSGFTPIMEDNPLSLASVLLAKINESSYIETNNYSNSDALSALTSAFNEDHHDISRKSRRLSAREFYASNRDFLFNVDQPVEDWEMVLASGIHQFDSKSSDLRNQDIICTGYSDGTLTAWGVSLPEKELQLGKGSVWLPLSVLRCGSAEITAIAHDELSGIIAAGDNSGNIVLWEIFDPMSNTGVSDIIKKLNERAAQNTTTSDVASQLAAVTLLTGGDDAISESEFRHSGMNFNDLEKVLLKEFNPTEIKEVLRTRLHDSAITSLLIVPQILTLFVGTEDGTIYATQDWKGNGPFFSIPRIDKGPQSSHAIISLIFAYFPLADDLIPAVYALNSCGTIFVIEIKSFNIISFAALPASGLSVHPVVGSDLDHLSLKLQSYSTTNSLIVVNSSYLPVPEQMVQSLMNSENELVNSRGVPSNTMAFIASPMSMDSSAHSSNSSESTLSTPMAIRVPPVADLNGSPDTNKHSKSFTAGSTQPSVAPNNRKSLFSAFSRSSTEVEKPSGTNVNTDRSNPSVGVGEHSRSPTLVKGILNPTSNGHEWFVPKYAVVVKGNYLLTYDLSKFVNITKKTTFAVSVFSSSSAPTNLNGSSAITFKLISNKKIRASKYRIFQYHVPETIEEETERLSNIDNIANRRTIPLLCCIVEDGSHIIISLRSKNAINHSNLTTGIIADEKVHVTTALCLPNGTCYLSKSNHIIYTALTTMKLENNPTASFVMNHEKFHSAHINPRPDLKPLHLPERVSPQAMRPETKFLLSHGREQLIASQKAALKKRRSSVINLSAAPTDLYKIFSKSKDLKVKEDLLGPSSRRIEKEHTESDNSINSTSTAKNVNNKTAKVFNEAAELAEQLQLKTEKMNRIALKMDDFKAKAQEYRNNVKAQRDKLKAKRSRWGFM